MFNLNPVSRLIRSTLLTSIVATSGMLSFDVAAGVAHKEDENNVSVITLENKDINITVNKDINNGEIMNGVDKEKVSISVFNHNVNEFHNKAYMEGGLRVYTGIIKNSLMMEIWDTLILLRQEMISILY